MASQPSLYPVLPMSKLAFVEDEPPSPVGASSTNEGAPDTDMTGTSESVNGRQNLESQSKKERRGWEKDAYKAAKKIRRLAPDDYYGFLGLQKTCSASEIRDQYKALAMLTHPDKNNFPDASDAFKRELLSCFVRLAGANVTELRGLKRLFCAIGP